MAQDIILWSLVTVDLPLSLSLSLCAISNAFLEGPKATQILCSDGPSNYLPIFHTFLCASFVLKQCAPLPPPSLLFQTEQHLLLQAFRLLVNSEACYAGSLCTFQVW